MDLTGLSDRELLTCTEKAAANEREATTLLLHHLCEVERRKLFADAGCASLFDYCVRILKMSEQQASRRVSAARALSDFPDIEDSLATGTLSLTAVAQAQSFFTREAKAARPLPPAEKKYILEKLENQSTRQAEKILLSHCPEPETFVKERVREITPTMTEMKILLDDKTMEHLQRLKEIWSHQMPGAGFSDIVKKTAEICREQLDPLRKAERAAVRADKSRVAKCRTASTRRESIAEGAVPSVFVVTARTDANAEATTANHVADATSLVTSEMTPAPESRSALSASTLRPQHLRTRLIHATVRHFVWIRDEGACTYVDPVTGARCGSRHLLQIDHLVPFAQGGENSTENLRLLCSVHNRLHGVARFGNRKMAERGTHVRQLRCQINCGTLLNHRAADSGATTDSFVPLPACRLDRSRPLKDDRLRRGQWELTRSDPFGRPQEALLVHAALRTGVSGLTTPLFVPAPPPEHGVTGTSKLA